MSDHMTDDTIAIEPAEGVAQEKASKRRKAIGGGAAALTCAALAACLLATAPAEAARVEGFAAKALIPEITVPGTTLASTGGEDADEAAPGEEAVDPGTEQAAADTTAEAQAQQAQGPQQAAPSETGSSQAPATSQQSQPKQQAPSASQGGSTAQPSAPAAPSHEHSWQPVTETRHVVDKAAWDEPVYETRGFSICNGCGADVTGFAAEHVKAAGRGSSCSGHHSEVRRVQVGTTHHEAVGHDETVTVGYKCSCGATK